MFWKIILWIYLGISILNLLMFFCIISSVRNSLTEEEKALLKEKGKDKGLAYTVMSYIKAASILFIPVANACTLLAMIAETDEIIEKIKLQTYHKIRER